MFEFRYYLFLFVIFQPAKIQLFKIEASDDVKKRRAGARLYVLPMSILRKSASFAGESTRDGRFCVPILPDTAPRCRRSTRSGRTASLCPRGGRRVGNNAPRM